jgi:hypothetical protein
MHTLPYISLPASLVKKEEKHSFYKKMLTSEQNSGKKWKPAKES